MLKSLRSPSAENQRDPTLARFVPRLSTLIAALLMLLLELLVGQASAHDLDIDSLSIRIETKSGTIDGQFLLDPDLTRPKGPQTELQGAEKEKERERLFGFIRERVVFRTEDQQLTPSLELRELYVKGGAVPGDSVMYRAQLPKGWQKLRVAIEKPLEQIAVTIVVDGAEKPSQLLAGAAPLLIHEIRDHRGASSIPAQGDRLSKNESPSVFRQAARHIVTGFVHIVPLGWDHILFVVALTLGSLGRYRRLILELSAFTVAHTITLGLGALRLVVVPPSVIEPLIAFSIAAVALEYLVGTENVRIRYALVGSFGLLHGLGFAGALLDLGFSGGSFLLFLASFNVGVELGQLSVVLISLAGFLLLSRSPRVRERSLHALAIAIAACGALVGVTRILG